MRLEDEETDDLWEFVNMFGRDQLGRQDYQRGCEQVRDFARGGEEVGKILRNGRMARRAIIDIEEIRRAESDPRSRDIDRIPVRVLNGWQGEDLLKMIRKERPRERSVLDVG